MGVIVNDVLYRVKVVWSKKPTIALERILSYTRLMNRFFAPYLCIFTLFTLSCTQEPAPIAPLEVGAHAPAVDTLHYLQGSSATFGNADKIHIIEFWATWCPPCKESAPILSALQQQYPDQLRIIGITEELENTVKPYLAQNGDAMTYSVAIDPEGSIHKAYIGGIGEEGIPWAFLIDAQGKLVWVGHPMSDELQHEVKQLLDDEN